LRILFVENHAVFAATAVEQLLCLHEVTIVPSIAAAREALARGPFDVALVDYDLDDGKGDELVRQLGAAGIELPIVATSAHDEGNRAILAAGADAVCAKKAFARIEDAIERASHTFAQTILRVHLEPPRAGWIRMRFSARGQRVEIDASYVPRDSMGDLANALLLLGQSGVDATVAFHEEPEITVLRLHPNGDRADLSLTRHPDHRQLEHTAAPLLSCSAPTADVLRAFLRPLQDLRRDQVGYERAWRHEFPERAVSALAELAR
jgi:CheY-like chemotaxis protein